MEIWKLIKLKEKYNIPDDCVLSSDSGWEVYETPCDRAYYSKEENVIIFTQEGEYSNQNYPDLILLEM